ncbi:MAG TPA: hypothetical protein VLN58_00005 [Verrucomicrobiae bacterium]|nr:hypothetical protein [Verrucomicrobiae bacterium]
MTSKLMRAPGKELAQPSNKRSLLTRGLWKAVMALVVMALTSVVQAQTFNNSVLIGHTGINQPRGMFLARVPNPAAPGTFVTDWWVTDSIAGLCRLDANGAIELATCDINGVLEPHDYQAETFGVNGSNGYVFVGAVGGVERVSFTLDAAGRTTIAPGTQFMLSTDSIFTNNTTINLRPAQLRVNAAALGPDGKLYVAFFGNTDIWRILNPLSPTFTQQGNKVERVGVTEGTGGRATSLAWIGHDLWMEDVGFINRIQDADLCFYTFPKCSAIIQFRNLFAHAGMASDQYFSAIPDGRYLYWGNGSRVVRYDTTTPGLMQVWNQQGTLSNGTLQHYSLITGIAFMQPINPLDPTTGTTPNPALPPDEVTLADGSKVANMTVVMDPFVNELFPGATLIPPRNNAGLTWLLPASLTLAPESQCDGLSTTAVIQNPPGCAIGAIGSNGQEAAPNPVAAKRAILLASGVTHPRGLLWLNSNWWVSDEALGFCRIDQNPITGDGTLTNCFQADQNFFPGQPAASQPDGTGQQIVYVPDASGNTSAIYRFIFTPNAAGGTLVLNGILDGTGSRKGTFLQSVALPTGPFNDGSLYLLYSDSGFVEKITSPDTAPGAPVQIARLFNGLGGISMAFNGNDLYISELGPPPIDGQFIKKGVVTNLLKASPSMSQGVASPVKRAIARLQTPQVIVENPGGFTVGPTTVRPTCLPPPGVVLSPSVPADPATTPALYMGTLGLTADGVFNPGVTNGLGEAPEVDQYDFVCNVQQVWVTDATVDPLLSTNVPLGAVTAMGFSSNAADAILAIGDDPAVIVPVQSRQHGVIRKNGVPGTGATGQGHVYIVP